MFFFSTKFSSWQLLPGQAAPPCQENCPNSPDEYFAALELGGINPL
jgi:hypothetical protein